MSFSRTPWPSSNARRARPPSRAITRSSSPRWWSPTCSRPKTSLSSMSARADSPTASGGGEEEGRGHGEALPGGARFGAHIAHAGGRSHELGEVHRALVQGPLLDQGLARIALLSGEQGDLLQGSEV